MIKSIEVTVTVVTDEHADPSKSAHQYTLSRGYGGRVADPENEAGAMARQCVMRIGPDLNWGGDDGD